MLGLKNRLSILYAVNPLNEKQTPNIKPMMDHVGTYIVLC